MLHSVRYLADLSQPGSPLLQHAIELLQDLREEEVELPLLLVESRTDKCGL